MPTPVNPPKFLPPNPYLESTPTVEFNPQTTPNAAQTVISNAEMVRSAAEIDLIRRVNVRVTHQVCAEHQPIAFNLPAAPPKTAAEARSLLTSSYPEAQERRADLARCVPRADHPDNAGPTWGADPDGKLKLHLPDYRENFASARVIATESIHLDRDLVQNVHTGTLLFPPGSQKGRTYYLVEKRERAQLTEFHQQDDFLTQNLHQHAKKIGLTPVEPDPLSPHHRVDHLLYQNRVDRKVDLQNLQEAEFVSQAQPDQVSLVLVRHTGADLDPGLRLRLNLGPHTREETEALARAAAGDIPAVEEESFGLSSDPADPGLFEAVATSDPGWSPVAILVWGLCLGGWYLTYGSALVGCWGWWLVVWYRRGGPGVYLVEQCWRPVRQGWRRLVKWLLG